MYGHRAPQGFLRCCLFESPSTSEFIETTSDDFATRAGLPFTHWAEYSNGKIEAHEYLATDAVRDEDQRDLLSHATPAFLAGGDAHISGRFQSLSGRSGPGSTKLAAAPASASPAGRRPRQVAHLAGDRRTQRSACHSGPRRCRAPGPRLPLARPGHHQHLVLGRVVALRRRAVLHRPRTGTHRRRWGYRHRLTLRRRASREAPVALMTRATLPLEHRRPITAPLAHLPPTCPVGGRDAQGHPLAGAEEG